MKKLTYLLLLVLGLMSCEEQPIDIPPFEGIISDRVVFIEELTGVRCPNCPSGAEKLEALRLRYPLNIVTVGVHGDFLAEPLSESLYDFRNEDAKALEKKLKWFGKPAAVFNRVTFEDAEIQGIDDIEQWQKYLERLLQEPHEIELDITSTYDASTGQASFTLTADPLITETNDYRVVVMLTEGEIEDAQENQGVIIEEYEHNHVLRKIVTDIDGETIATSITAGQSISKTINVDLPEVLDGRWNSEHIEVVAFISKVINNTNIVMQGAEVKLK